MKSILLFFALISGTNTFLPPENLNCNEWKLKTETGNYKVYMRECDASPIKEIKLLDKFEGDFTRLVGLMNDIETNKKITESCTEARLLKQIDKQTSLQYFYYKMPIGVNDRDVVSKITINVTDSTYSFATEAVNNNLVAQKKMLSGLQMRVPLGTLKKLFPVLLKWNTPLSPTRTAVFLLG